MEGDGRVQRIYVHSALDSSGLKTPNGIISKTITESIHLILYHCFKVEKDKLMTAS